MSRRPTETGNRSVDSQADVRKNIEQLMEWMIRATMKGKKKKDECYTFIKEELKMNESLQQLGTKISIKSNAPYIRRVTGALENPELIDIFRKHIDVLCPPPLLDALKNNAKLHFLLEGTRHAQWTVMNCSDAEQKFHEVREGRASSEDKDGDASDASLDHPGRAYYQTFVAEQASDESEINEDEAASGASDIFAGRLTALRKTPWETLNTGSRIERGNRGTFCKSSPTARSDSERFEREIDEDSEHFGSDSDNNEETNQRGSNDSDSDNESNDDGGTLDQEDSHRMSPVKVVDDALEARQNPFLADFLFSGSSDEWCKGLEHLTNVKNSIEKYIAEENLQLQVRWGFVGFPCGFDKRCVLRIIFDGPLKLLDGLPRKEDFNNPHGVIEGLTVPKCLRLDYDEAYYHFTERKERFYVLELEVNNIKARL
ncbi:hypothetical protein BDV09DRAFT_201055 [Aspergillus tetrazonus]